MKAVWVGTADDSGTSNRITRAVNRANGLLKMRCITARRSVCEYEEDVCIERDGMGPALDAIADADWIIQLGDSNYSEFFKLVHTLEVVDIGSAEVMAHRMRDRGIKLGTRFAGTLYRNNHEMYETKDERIGWDRRFFPCDLLRFVVADQKARVFIQPQDSVVDRLPKRGHGPLRVCHTPSAPLKKGTPCIEAGMQYVDGVEYETLTGLSYNELNARRQTYHVVIDQQNPEHGCFGAAAMEALAQAKVVVSNWHFADTADVDRWIPRPPILMARSCREVAEQISKLKCNEYYKQCQIASWEWARKYLTDKFTYRYWSHCLDLGAKSWDPTV